MTSLALAEGLQCPPLPSVALCSQWWKPPEPVPVKWGAIVLQDCHHQVPSVTTATSYPLRGDGLEPPEPYRHDTHMKTFQKWGDMDHWTGAAGLGIKLEDLLNFNSS